MKLLSDFVNPEPGVLIGVCSADRLSYLEALDFDAPFIPTDIEKKIDPKAVMKDARSVIVVLLSYRRIKSQLDDRKKRGRIAAFAARADYHRSLKTIMRSITSALPPNNSVMLVDSAKLNERAFAFRAGLGFIGRNRFLINDEFGSFTNIGLILTDLELYPTIPEEEWIEKYVQKTTEKEFRDEIRDGFKDSNESQMPTHKQSAELTDSILFANCGSCRVCVKACPGKALSEDGFDYSRCVSYLTQKKDALSESDVKAIGRHVYGCDVCQDVCPFNAGVSESTPVMQRLFSPELEWLSDISEEEFQETFGETCIAWRGAGLLRRNAQAILRSLRE